MDKNTYEVTIEETLKQTVMVKAGSRREALQIGSRMYKDLDVILTADDFTEVNIKASKYKA